MNQAFICDAVRTPFGRFGGTLATVRADDLAALPLRRWRSRAIWVCPTMRRTSILTAARLPSVIRWAPPAVVWQ